MTNTIRYPLRNISPHTLRDLQEHYPNASVQIELSEEPQHGGLAESDFWDLIARLDWAKSGNDEAVIAPVVEALANAPLRHIYDFADILSHKLYLLDGERFCETEMLDDPDFVADRFLYTRCCVVANGRGFFRHILENPSEMPHDLLFGPLLRIPGEAHQRQLGKFMTHVSAYPIETGSNPEGWPNFITHDGDAA
ncbi:MAG: DUF4240 domain-containing protein [Saprospiraceae bacterium]